MVAGGGEVHSGEPCWRRWSLDGVGGGVGVDVEDELPAAACLLLLLSWRAVAAAARDEGVDRDEEWPSSMPVRL